jgi:thiol-disulfide isomerase/thioredoxin
MTPVQPAARRVRWWPGLTWSLLILAQCSLARADPVVTSLFKPLDPVGYPSRLTPPHWRGGTLDVRHVSMPDLRGKVVLVNFWASWCPECRQEMPVLERLHRELAPQGLAIVGVNAWEKREAASRYVKELGLTFPLVLDPDGKISALYGVIGLPATFLVGRDGRAVAFAIGPREWAGAPARALFNALLAEPAPPPSAQ